MSFQIHRCDNSTSEIECAYFGENDEHLYEYLERHSLGVIKGINYIDYDSIDPFKGPLKHACDWVELIKVHKIESDNWQFRRFSLNEHVIELNDSLYQIMTEPEVLQFLNLNDGPPIQVIDFARHDRSIFLEYAFDLSQKI